MAGWFVKLMERDHARGRAVGGEGVGVVEVGVATQPAATSGRDSRYDAVVQALRDGEALDRSARAKRQRWYKQSLEIESNDPSEPSCARLYKFSTKVPCRATAEARALLDDLRRQYAGGTLSFSVTTNGRQRVMLTRRAGAEPKQIGWLEQSAQTDATLCNVHHQGLTVDTDGDAMLLLRFHYPATPVRISSPPRADELASVEFSEIRPALDQRPSEKGSLPRLVWMTRPERETMNALKSREFEGFYLRFKLAVQSGLWTLLSELLSNASSSHWHHQSHYTLLREPDAVNRRIRQRTIDDNGRPASVGGDRVYDVAPATDVLLLYLERDILADLTDIYFTLQSLGSADSYFLKEEFFALIRRFWASSESLASSYGCGHPAVVRMAQRAMPMPAQAALLTQDWTNLRELLVDRYGEGGRNAAGLVRQDLHRTRVTSNSWPFACVPTGEFNLGLRLVYRQSWRLLSCGAGEVREAAPIAETPTFWNLEQVVDEAAKATIDATKWPVDLDGRLNTGIRALAVRTAMGLESESRESSRETSDRVSDAMLATATRLRDEKFVAINAAAREGEDTLPLADIECSIDSDDLAPVYRVLESHYEIVSRPAEIQNVIMVAEKLPAPNDIDASWLERHQRILTTVLLDESLRDTLTHVGREPAPPQLAALREHVKANVLHYQRAIWQHEDPQQRSMRYRKSGRKVPLDWRFELEAGPSLTIEELADRLVAPNLDSQFSAYSGGREVELDDLIEPTGPIGYYGNYAVHPMRAAFGSADLFSMLHFFKSPYLRPNPETGAPEVDDPSLKQTSDDGFRGRARSITFATNRVVREVVAGSEPSAAEPNDIAFHIGEDFRLLSECEHPAEFFHSNGHHDEATAWEIVASGEVAAVAVSKLRDELILTGGDVRPFSPGVRNHPEAARVQLSREYVGLTLTAGAPSRTPAAAMPVLQRTDVKILTGAAAPKAFRLDEAHIGLRTGWKRDTDAERPLRPNRNEAASLTAVAGAGVPHPAERLILRESAEETKPKLRTGRLHHREADTMILTPDDAGRQRDLHAGRARGPEGDRVIQLGKDARPGLTALSGSRVTYAHQQLILPADDDWLRPSLFAG